MVTHAGPFPGGSPAAPTAPTRAASENGLYVGYARLYGGEGQRSRYANLTSVHARRLALALMMEVHRIEKKRLVGRQQ